MTNSKTCTKCKETKTLDAFSKDKQRKDGLRPSCKPCAAIKHTTYYKVNADKVKAVNKAWKEANLERYYASIVSWKEANEARSAAIQGKAYALRTTPDSITYDFDFEATVSTYSERIRVTKETGVVHHVDHIVALANGGLHHADNLQVLTAEANSAKAAKE